MKVIARIQTFPDLFQFSYGNNSSVSRNGRVDKIYKQIGNAVPIVLARAMASPIAHWSTKNLNTVMDNRNVSQQLSLFYEIEI
ncbi:DNA cytosine methyltransferase [Psychrobacillus glaciei]|uniref:DNA cytosine methyltransferase n=1 Tax=Psychrobacillus glaciei TaxID=2283160 RepID=UPI00178C2653